MKTKTSNLRRHFAFAYVLLVAVIFCGCNKTDQEVKDYSTGKVGNLKQCLIVTEIDSCEYIVGHVPDGDYGWVMAHKGNCKFCAERSKK